MLILAQVIGVPHKHRGQLWNVLLGVRPRGEGPTSPETTTAAGDEAKQHRSTRLMSLTPDHRPNLAALGGDESDHSASNGSEAAPSESTASGAPTVGNPPSPTKFDLHNQRVIRADIERTLPHLHTFQRPQVRHDMEVILTTYCKQHEVSYKQGQSCAAGDAWEGSRRAEGMVRKVGSDFSLSL